AIDMVLVNEEMYETCKDMRIDEEKEIISFSDHNLVSVTLRLGEKGRKTFETGKWTEDVFLKRDKKSVKENGEELERRWTENESRNVNDMISKMQEVQDILLIKKVKRKIGGEDNKEIECNWMTDEIRKEISKKRDIRKKLRRCENETEKERLTSIEDNQKIKIQLMVKEAKEVEEKKIEKEIRNSDNKGRMIWNLINKIRGKRIIPEEDEIFKNVLKMEIEEARKCFFGDWRGILAARENKAYEIWDEEIKKEMIESRDNIDTRIWIEEHLDMASRIEYRIRSMDTPRLERRTLEKIIEKLKDKKAPGPDKIVGEVYKDIIQRKKCRDVLLKCLNQVLDEEEVPESWVISQTKMIKKIKKPSTRDFRPIALLNVSYKIYMSFIREEIENHLRRNNQIRDNQIGFTEGGRI
ncbi:unnamed protein product, partial [Meganyctiphanes norvegica]